MANLLVLCWVFYGNREHAMVFVKANNWLYIDQDPIFLVFDGPKN